MTERRKHTLGASALVILAVLFIALIIVSNALFRGVRLDLTENNLYTLAEGTRNILDAIEEPINLYYFFSEEQTENTPFLRSYANRVRELLEEFALESDGKLNLQVIDPQPFSEQEERAAAFGLQAVPTGPNGESIYFGLAGTNAVDTQLTIPFFQQDNEEFLEYDVAKLVHSLTNPDKPIIGLYSSLPMTIGFDATTQQIREPWVITSQIEQLFDVRPLDAAMDGLDEVDVLMLVHPKSLSEDALYAIDQFVVGGGKALIFVDPHSESDVPPQDPSNPYAAMVASRASDLKRLFEAWGIRYDSGDVLADRRYALEIGTGGGGTVRHLGILGFTDAALSSEDIVTAGLDSVNVAMAGFLGVDEEKSLNLTPLVESSDEAMPMPAGRFAQLSDPATLQNGFKATGERYVVAARLEGKVASAFPDGRPADAAGEPDDAASEDSGQPADGGAKEAPDDEAAADGGHLAESAEAVNLIVAADTDLLSDWLWVRTQSFFGQRVSTAWANNGDMVANSLDNLTGSSDLISIRGRATFSRPFEKVEALERAADEALLAKEQALQAELAETERKLTELQANRDDQSAMILTSEQSAAIERFQAENLRVRRELRQVRHDLEKDIENLGTWLKVINIAFVPLLITIVALLILMLRRKRRKVARHTAPAVS
ncbi:MAG: Gldg family protein [Gammaproteobacteria bacterium]|nr:Gldg family protein [Gammaproteobacteria bacterium]